MSPEHVDVLIVGAGLSGVGAGYHLQTRCPGKTYAIFESRADLGGTWDLFRYPAPYEHRVVGFLRQALS